MIVAGIAIAVFQGQPSGPSVAPQTNAPPPMIVEDLLGDQLESGRGMVIQIADKDDPTRLSAEILADRYDPDGPTIRLVENPRAWLFGEDGSAWLIEADKGRFYIPEGEDTPREGTLTGNVLARRYEPDPVNPNDQSARPDPDTATPALTATTDEPLRFNLDILNFETDGLLKINTDTIQFSGRGAFVVLNESQESIQTLRVDRGERIVYTPLAPPPPAETTDSTEADSSNADPNTNPNAGLGTDRTASKPAPAEPVSKIAASSKTVPPKIDYYKVIFSDTVRGETGPRTITADQLTVWARLIDNNLPTDPAMPIGTATARGPLEAALLSIFAIQDATEVARDSERAAAGGFTSPGRFDANGDLAVSLRPDAPDATEPRESAAPEPVVLTWDGPLTVEPLTEAPKQLTRGDHLALRFEANHGQVNIRDTAADASAEALAATYFAQRERVELEGSGGSIVMESPGAGRIRGMNAVEIELASGVVTIPTAGELFGKDHNTASAEPEYQSVTWTEEASFVFAVSDGRITDRLERAGFRGRVVGKNQDATINGDTLLSLFDTPPGEAPRLLQLNVEAARAEDGRGSSVGGEGMEVHFARGTYGQDIDPTRTILSGDAFARREGRETIRGQWIDADLARDEGGKVIVTVANARGEVEFDDGLGTRGAGETLFADVLSERATITGEGAWVQRDLTRIGGPDIRLDSATRRVEVFGPGSFDHNPSPNPSAAGATENPPARTISALWTDRMAFDDNAGTVTCLGGVSAVSPSADGTTDTVTGDRLEIVLTPRQDAQADTTDRNADQTAGVVTDRGSDRNADRLRYAEVFGTPESPARAESRRVAITPRPAPADAGDEPERPATDPTPAPAIEELFRLDGEVIRFAAASSRIEVPGPGRFFMLDHRPRAEGDAGVSGPDGRGGTTLATWEGSMEFDRSTGRAVFRDDARIANKPLGAVALSEVIAREITAAFTPAGTQASNDTESGDLRWAIAKGDALLRMEDRREIVAETLIYSPEEGRIQALAPSGQRVEITDLMRGETTNARAIIWDLVDDRITLTSPGDIIFPQ